MSEGARARRRAERRRRRPRGPRRPSPTTIGTPRARASMATWLVGLPAAARCRRRASRSPGTATASRSSATTIAPGRHAGALGRPRRAPQHPVADVAQVGGAGAEIVVFGWLVAGDLRVERRVQAAARRARRRRPKAGVGRASSSAWRSGSRACRPRRRPGAPTSAAELCDGRVDGLAQRLGLLAGRSLAGTRRLAAVAMQHLQRSGGKARRGRRALERGSRASAASVLAEILVDQRRPARRAPPSASRPSARKWSVESLAAL